VPNALLFAGTLGLAGAYFYAIFATIQVRSFGDPVGPRMFPILLGCALVLSSAMLAYETWWKPRLDVESSAEHENRRGPLVILAVGFLTFAYFLVFERLGYVVSTAAYLTLLMSYFHKGRPLINISTAVGFSLSAYLLFTRALQVSLPPGVLPF
jgi:putative tricarboxylic transport membrane protein